VRSWRLAGVATAGAAAIAVLVLVLSGGSDAKAQYHSERGMVKRELAARLHRQLLRPHWIACVPSGRSFHSAAVIRCNVNFGDPHIQAYCSVLRGPRLVTQYDDPSIPCGHDDAGWRAPVQILN
jgi:hypothetical protein